jgi:pyrroline-5-carboxylate reductase
MLITFIGGGNMASALISGLVNPPRADLCIRVVDPDDAARGRLHTTFGLPVFADTEATAAIDGADVILLAIKPQTMPVVLRQLAGHVGGNQLVLSIAAGTTIATIRERLGPDIAVVRCMPNTPALMEEILLAAGEVVWLENETLMDAVTAVSGTGPAYFFLLTEVLTTAARELGLPPETAERLAAITCFGAGAMMATSPDEAEELRRRVTSPGGTTEAAMAVLDDGGFRNLMMRAVAAACDRSRELSGTSGASDAGENAE